MRCYGWCQEQLLIVTCLMMTVTTSLTLLMMGDLLAYHGLTLPLILLILCGLLGSIAAVFVHSQRFRGEDQSHSCLIVIGILFFFCGLGCLIFLALFTHKEHRLGRMDSYLTCRNEKKIIDKTQMLFGCCGDNSYTDWFKVDWQGIDSAVWGEPPPRDAISRMAVPFSCCSAKARPSCVHNYLQMGEGSRLYQKGCKQAINLFAIVLLVISAGSLIVTGIFMLQWAYCCKDDSQCYDYDEYCPCDIETPQKGLPVEESKVTYSQQDVNTCEKGDLSSTTLQETDSSSITSLYDKPNEVITASEPEVTDSDVEPATTGEDRETEDDEQTDEGQAKDIEKETQGTEPSTIGEDTEEDHVDSEAQPQAEDTGEETEPRVGEVSDGELSEAMVEAEGPISETTEELWPPSEPSTEDERPLLNEEDVQRRLTDEGETEPEGENKANTSNEAVDGSGEEDDEATETKKKSQEKSKTLKWNPTNPRRMT